MVARVRMVWVVLFIVLVVFLAPIIPIHSELGPCSAPCGLGCPKGALCPDLACACRSGIVLVLGWCSGDIVGQGRTCIASGFASLMWMFLRIGPYLDLGIGKLQG